MMHDPTDTSHPAALLREDHRLLSGADAEFGEDRGDMIAHGAGRKGKSAGDLLRRFATLACSQHVEFAVRQGLRSSLKASAATSGST